MPITITQGGIFGESSSVFGKFTFGNPLGNAQVPTYSAAPMSGTATDYATIKLTWTVPNIGYKMRLVRNSFSIPADQNDGVVLAEFPYTFTPDYTDPFLAASSGRWLYYALFMLTSAVPPQGLGGYWQRAASCQVMLPQNWGYGTRLYQLVPQWFQDLDTEIDSPLTAVSGSSGLTSMLAWSHFKTWGKA